MHQGQLVFAQLMPARPRNTKSCPEYGYVSGGDMWRPTMISPDLPATALVAAHNNQIPLPPTPGIFPGLSNERERSCWNFELAQARVLLAHGLKYDRR
jgi:hypothetical protein